MIIDGKEVPEYKPCGPEWRKAMLTQDKGTLVSILKTKCEECETLHELSGALREGLEKAAQQRDDLRQELDVVQAERDEWREQKERAELRREDHMAGCADLAHASGESR